MAFHQSNPYHPTATSSRVVASDGFQGVDDAGQLCRVILTGLPKDDDVTETAVLEMVESAIKAEAASARLTYNSTGQCLGLAIVTLFSFAHAKKLYEEIDGEIIDGEGTPIRIHFMLAPGDAPPKFITNLIIPRPLIPTAPAARAAAPPVTKVNPAASTTNPPATAPTGPRVTRPVLLNGKQRAVAPAPTMKTAETKSNSLLGRIDIGLRHRIEGLAPAGGAKGVKPMMKGFKGTTAQQQKVLTRTSIKPGKKTSKAAAAATANLANQLAVKKKTKPTTKQLQASNIATPKSKVKKDAAAPVATRPAKSRRKSQQELDDELKAYNRSKKFGPVESEQHRDTKMDMS